MKKMRELDLKSVGNDTVFVEKLFLKW